jgi:hypothetical protein
MWFYLFSDAYMTTNEERKFQENKSSWIMCLDLSTAFLISGISQGEMTTK